MNGPITVLYHDRCFDGFGAAWAFAQKFGYGKIDSPDYIGCAYGEPIPDIKDSNLFVLDFSFPREDMVRLYAKNTSMLVLDHHKTAEANCKGLDFCIFDMNRSGAGIAWDYFFPNKPRPKLIDYVEDRDLWRFKLPTSKEIHAYIASWPMDFNTWGNLSWELEAYFDNCLDAGTAILRYQNQKASEIAAFESLQRIGNHEVPVVNAPYNFASDVLEKLVNEYPTCPFAASYFFRADGTKQYSLRGRSTDDFDVSEVARLYGGGGHKKAAGFEIAPTGNPIASRGPVVI